MKFRLITIGKTGKSYFMEAENEYLKRLAKYIHFEKTEIPDIRNAKNLTQAQIKQEEGKLLLAKLDKGAFVVLLDENGKTMGSEPFARWIQSEMNKGHKHVNFLIGGAYGFSEEVYQAASAKISLSPMTFNHQMVRMIFIEQVYRAFSILNNEPYHHA